MKNLKSIFFLFSFLLSIHAAKSQANASINILTQNSGIVYVGGVGYVQVDISNTGPANAIGVNKVRAQISIPGNCQALPNGQQDGIPAGWIILNNSGSVVQICNGTDIIPVNASRVILIKVQGVTVGGPSTVSGVLSFGPGTGVCTGPGSLPGDITADNVSTSTINVINAPTCNLNITASATAIICNGGTSTLTIVENGSNGSVEYSLNAGPYQSSNIFTVTAGNYAINAREINLPSCNKTINIIISEPAVLAAPTVSNIIQPTCTVVTGSVQLNNLPNGSWTINPGNINGNNASAILTSLTAGTYNFTVTNSLGCVSLPSNNIVIQTPPTAPGVPTVNIIQPDCNVSTGSIAVSSATSGLTFSLDGGSFVPYPMSGYTLNAGSHSLTAMNADGCVSSTLNFSVDTPPAIPAAPLVNNITQPTCISGSGSLVLSGLPVGNWTIQPGNISGNGSSVLINNLSPGNYNFTVTNAGGCVSLPSANSIINNVSGAPDAPIVNVVQPDCVSNSALVQVTSSIAGLTFSLDGSPYSNYPSSGYVVLPGIHSLTVQNSSGCFSSPTQIIINNQPLIPAPPVVTVMHPTCTNATGKILITSDVTGMLVSLDNSNFSVYPAGGFIVSSGSHFLSVQNAAGCNSQPTTIIVNAQPTQPIITINQTPINCYGGISNINISVNGGTMPYLYNFNNSSFQLSNTFSVPAGNHVFAVQDAYGCENNISLTVVQPNAIQLNYQIDSIICFANSGTLTGLATGGTSPYTYNIDGGAFQSGGIFPVNSGVHTITVKDANGCIMAGAPVVLTQPDTLLANAVAKRITVCGGVAEIRITGAGGRMPYVGTGVFTRGAGTWNFNITDAAGCTATTSVTIEPPGCMRLIVFPNPASEFINVHHSLSQQNALFQIYNMAGALVLTKTVSAGKIQSRLNIQNLSLGNYVLVLINGNERKHIRFSKNTF